MFIQIIKNGIKFLNQIFSSAIAGLSGRGIGFLGNPVFHIIYEKGHQFGINQHFPKTVILEVVPAKLRYQIIFLRINGAAGAFVD